MNTKRDTDGTLIADRIARASPQEWAHMFEDLRRRKRLSASGVSITYSRNPLIAKSRDGAEALRPRPRRLAPPPSPAPYQSSSRAWPAHPDFPPAT
jgi:hypothetical protein